MSNSANEHLFNRITRFHVLVWGRFTQSNKVSSTLTRSYLANSLLIQKVYWVTTQVSYDVNKSHHNVA